ncbi:MAG: hypothetical protein ACRCTG_16625 [Aestuariivirga sp.]
MAKLRFAQFSGEIPRLLSRLLPDTGAQHAENVRLDDGGLTPMRKSRLEHVFDEDGLQTIYKWGSTWLGWASVVHAVPGPVATDRLYYTGDGAPKMRVGTTVYDLKLPYPTAALTAAVTGTGTGDVTTRLYVYTWVTQFGEESEPCPVTAEVLWQAGQTVTLSGFAATPAGRGITKQRIYRSQSSSQSGTDLFLIEERDATTSNYVDTHSPEDFGEVLPSRDWSQPPDDLKGLISLPNGMMAAFSGKQLCFCEPYRPHAWPEKYRMTAAFPIVGLGAYGTTVVAGTEGYPYVASGNAPEAMIEEKIEVNLPCINGRGLVDLGYSVAYPSNDGLVVVSNGGATVATDALFTRQDWLQISPADIVSGQFAGRYFASYSYLELDNVTLREGTIVIDLTGQQPFVLRTAFKAAAFHYEVTTGKLYYLLGREVYEFDALGKTNEIMTWRSKRFVFSQPVTFGAILIERGATTIEQQQARLEELEALLTYNSGILSGEDGITGGAMNEAEIDLFAVNGDILMRTEPDAYISVKVYADGRLIRTVAELDRVKRIPPNTARTWEIQVNGTAEVEQITLATSARELTEI